MKTRPNTNQDANLHGVTFLNLPRIMIAILTAWVFLVAHTASAGQSCDETPPTADALEKGLNLGVKAFAALDASDADVALIARAGQDLGKYGLKYSHMAFVVRDHAKGRWTIMHMLNHCGRVDSGLFVEGLGSFFMDTPFQYEAQIVIPSKEIQTRLKTILDCPLPQAFKAERYNMLAYPYNTASQNSNGWVLELLSAGIATVTIDSRLKAVSYAKAKGFEPTTIRLNTFERLGVDLTRTNISFNDHPFARRMGGNIDTVTVASVVAFLLRNDAGVRVVEVGL